MGDGAVAAWRVGFRGLAVADQGALLRQCALEHAYRCGVEDRPVPLWLMASDLRPELVREWRRGMRDCGRLV